MFTLLSRSTTLKRLASAYGMATPGSFARRFIAGEQIDDAIVAARALQAKVLAAFDERAVIQSLIPAIAAARL